MWKFARDHPGFVLTALAIAVSGIGILHEIVLLLAFGLNYFEYADASDFLVAAGKTFVLLTTSPKFITPLIQLVIFMPAVTLLQFYAIRKSMREVGEIKEKTGKFDLLQTFFFVRNFGIIVLVIVGAAYWQILSLASDAAQNSAARIKEGNADRLLIELRRPERTMPGIGSAQNVHAITGTNQYLFYYERSQLGISDKEPSNERVYVIPTSNLAQQVVIERYVSQPSDSAPFWRLF